MVDITSKTSIIVIVGVGIVLFGLFGVTDLTTFFTTQSLTLDASQSQGKASDRGVDASTGQFRGQGFKGNLPPRIIDGNIVDDPTNDLPPSTIVDIIDARDLGANTGVAGIEIGSGGQPSSTIGLQGFQQLTREDLVIYDRFHTPAKGQTITGALLFEWGHPNPITVQQVLIPNEYFDWFEFRLPQTIQGDGALSFDGRSTGEFEYVLTLPENIDGEEFAVPVRIIVESDITTLDANAIVEIETPKSLISTFSLAEFLRSLFTALRLGN